MRFFLLLCVVLASTAALAANDKSRVLVLEPSSEVIDKPTLGTIASLMLVELSKNPTIEVVSATDVRRLAELEGDKQAMGCADNSCLADLAGAMGARYVVFGDVGKLGSLMILNLNLFDSTKAVAVNRVTVKASGAEDLAGKLDAGVRDLVAPLFGAPPVAAASTVTAPPTPVDDGKTSPALIWGLIGGGAAVVVGGGAFDLLSPTSDDKVVDGYDVIGPIGMLGGLALAGAGVALMVTSP